MERTSYSSGGKWESPYGYLRAVRIGASVFVLGATAANSDGNARGDPYEHTIEIFTLILDALHSVKAELRDVVRTRIYVVNMADSDKIGTAHGEIFGQILPAATMVEVKSLITPSLLVEIEADAIVG